MTARMIQTPDGNYEFTDLFGQVWTLRVTADRSIPFTISLKARAPSWDYDPERDGKPPMGRP